ncbi:MAG: NAD-dependent epimerase/dehydratase family protein [bacterium]|jgi:2'-hydroxyisoflavone reductase
MLCDRPGTTRRTFLGSLALAGFRPPRLRILILGGTGFLGPATVAAAQARGHQLTLFNRGRTRPGLFPGIETLRGDRDPNKGEGLRALAGRKWDVVIDNSAYYPRHVTASARLLASAVSRYIIISSISVYKDNSTEGLDETAAVATIPDPTVETMGPNSENYGALKALCETAAEKEMPGRVAVVRPGYIVGPDDPSGRFTYWPVRFSRGGELLVPGSPDDPIQFIDVRDLGEWLITLAESRTTGVFNATGPARPLAWGSMIEACRALAPSGTTPVWVPAAWIAKQNVEFPIWAPYAGETRGFHKWSNKRAIQAGLRFRPHPETIRDTLAWYIAQPEGGRTQLAGPTPEKERELLAAWRASA